jgi:hypothetical protein
MSKLFTQVLVAFLVSSLLADPALADVGGSNQAQPIPINSLMPYWLDDQALAATSLFALASLQGLLKSLIIRRPDLGLPQDLPNISAAGALRNLSPEALSGLDWKPYKAGVEKAQITRLAGQPLDKPLFVARKHAVFHDPDHYAFHRQLVMALLDEYFWKHHEYLARHVRSPLAYAGGHYYYLFTQGTNRIFARDFPTDRLLDSREFRDSFARAGIRIDQDVYLGQKKYPSDQITARSEHLLSWGWRLHNIVRFNNLLSFRKTRDWIRIDFSNESQSVNDQYRFSQFISEAHGEGLLLKKVLGAEKTHLLIQAFAGLPEGSGIYFDQTEFDRLIGRYQQDVIKQITQAPPVAPKWRRLRRFVRQLTFLIVSLWRFFIAILNSFPRFSQGYFMVAVASKFIALGVALDRVFLAHGHEFWGGVGATLVAGAWIALDISVLHGIHRSEPGGYAPRNRHWLAWGGLILLITAIEALVLWFLIPAHLWDMSQLISSGTQSSVLGIGTHKALRQYA